MGKTILFGEPMALLIADTTGPLENVEHFTRALSGSRSQCIDRIDQIRSQCGISYQIRR